MRSGAVTTYTFAIGLPFGFRWTLAEELHERARGATQVRATTVDEHDRNRETHGRNRQRPECADPELFLHTALGHEPQAEAGLHQPLLRGEAVDRDDLGVAETERGPPLHQHLSVALTPRDRSHREGR